MKKTTLSYHIIRNVLLFCIGLFLVTFSVYYYFTRNTIRETTRENAIFLARNTINRIEEVLSPAEKIPEIVAKTLESEFLSKDSLIPFLKSVLSINNNVYGSIIAYEPDFFPEQGTYFAPYAYRQGDSICSSVLGDKNYEYFYMDWYQIPKITNAPYWSEPYFDEGGGNVLMTTYSVPFHTYKNGARVFSGIVTVDISLEWLTKIMSQVKILDTGYAFLLSRNGVVIAHPNKDYVMNQTIFTIAKENNQPSMRETGRNMIQGKSNFESAGFKSKWKSGKLWINYAPLPSSHWSIGVIYPDKEMFASLHRINIILLILIVTGLFLLSYVIYKIVNNLTSPLKHFAESARLIAEGNFNVQLPQIKTEDEMKELYNSFSYMQRELGNYIATLKETTTAKEKIESELRIAKEIQMSMIPHIFPPFPDLPQIDVFAVLKSAKEVGGDLYDFFVIDGNKFCFAIGDVSGKGVPASLFMAVTRTLVRSISDKEFSPSVIVGTLNKSISQNNESSMFVTLFLGVLDLSNGVLNYTNAGHNPPVIIKNSRESTMFEKTKYIPVGLFEDFEYGESSLQLDSGDKIFLYTDGVSEAENSENDLFGDNAIMEIISGNLSAPPRELINKMEEGISAHVKGFTQSDDITMMTIVYNG
ncbi:MAG: SpoIIE family protein phosphatase [Bacteroidales bacterium]|nr:SpoIIE family protein phosphatase [Bacteroidales bacterium]